MRLCSTQLYLFDLSYKKVIIPNHQAIQNNVLVATGICVMVHFDYQAHKSLAIPEALCARLMSLN